MSRLLAIAVLLAAPAAFAFSLSRTDSHHVIRWYDNDETIELQIDANGPTRLRSADTPTDVRDAIDSAIDSWNSIACNGLTLTVGGTTTDTANVVSDGVDAVDGINRVVWIETASRYPYSAQVLGVTSPVFYQDGTIIEADIIFNGVDDNWAVYANLADVPGGSTNGQAVDIESVVVHELGHLIGLGHVLNGAAMSEPPTMTPTVDPQLRTRTLEGNDRAGACFLYPSSGATDHPCSNSDQCPEFISSSSDNETIADRSQCVSGQCTKIEDVPCGDGDLGERCCVDNCKGQTICLPLADDQTAYCASRCDPTRSDACPDGFTCAPTSTGGGVCVTDVVLGCDCDTNDQCTSSCACDSDCDNPPPSTETDDNNCAAGGHLEVWSLLVVLGLFASRRSLRLA